MVASIPASEQRFSRLSFSEIRVVPAKPLTLALTRLDWREASNSYTSVAGIPLARARLRIGTLKRGSSSVVYLLNRGEIKTGAIITTKAVNPITTALPHTHQFLPSRLTTPNKIATRRAPSTATSASPTNWSRIHSQKV